MVFMKPEIIPAILVQLREDLFDRIRKVKPYVDTVQIDIMDGMFVPNNTIGVKHLRGLPEGVKYELHWMVLNPERWIEKVHGDYLHIVHVETIDSLDDVQKIVKKNGGRLGIAINPGTQFEKVLPYLKKVDYVLVMTVNPGFSGQKYIKGMEERVREIRKKFKDIDIEVDGGLDKKTAYSAAAAGANKIVAASSIFKAFSIGKAVKELQESAEKGCKTWAKKSSG
ncbi:MAG TPA: ribulose-phosphate 3-epimerase [Chromatiaceae bacterium]|nr:ribulose-phosphate 3-epimerase [Chromatiaceae bacterium]